LINRGKYPSTWNGQCWHYRYIVSN